MKSKIYADDKDGKDKSYQRRLNRGKYFILFALVLVLFLEFLWFFVKRHTLLMDIKDLDEKIKENNYGIDNARLEDIRNGNDNHDAETARHESNDEPTNEVLEKLDSENKWKENDENANEPDLYGLINRIREALLPFMYKFIASHDPDRVPPPCNSGYGPMVPNTFLAGCTEQHGCKHTKTLKEAQDLCSGIMDCGGVVQTAPNRFEIRSSDVPEPSKFQESSWVKQPCDARFRKHSSMKEKARGIWEAFQEAVDKALDDPSLNLRKKYGPAREDNSIFLSIASYRDPSCASTVKRAFERADHPEKLFVGVVQQNCMHDCMTGTGWAATRRWVKQDHPDPDCIESFCASELGSPHCKAGRVNILRLEEIDSLGPFFTRFLNSKMWRGENFYLQIDAHTDFREGWDTSMIEQMRATPTYPYSVISNYPPGGSPDRNEKWARATTPIPNYGVPSALCHCTFEDAGGRHMTVRLAEISRGFQKNVDQNIPHQTSFVAAGFFIAHGSIVDDVQFDPFLPYLFMGEEIVLSIRFWTYGYDIYGPSIDVLKHEYVRSEHPKFWESISMIFSNDGIHNSLTDLVVERVQHIVGFPEALEPEQVEPQSLLTRVKEFSCGTKRLREDFIKYNNLDLVNKRQIAPDWCLHGLEPPWTLQHLRKEK